MGALEFRSFFHRLSFQLVTVWPTPTHTVPTAKSIAAHVTSGARSSVASSGSGANIGAATSTAATSAAGTNAATPTATATAATATSAHAAKQAATSTPSISSSAISRLFGAADGYTVSQRTVKERCLAKVLYGNDALLTMVKSAAAATTAADPVLKLPAEQSILVVNAITTELSQIVASNFFVAEASRSAAASGFGATKYYEHSFPFALVYARLNDVQKLRVVLGSESLVDAWGSDHFHHF